MPAEERRDGGPAVPPVVRLLLGGIIDYAGLFPPAALSMRSAVENYASYRSGPDAWALGRFVVPAARLDELVSTITSLDDSTARSEWRVSAVIGPELAADLERVHAFNRGMEAVRRDIAVDVLELKGSSEEEIRRAVELVPPGFTSYVEIPLERDPHAEGASIPACRGAPYGRPHAESDPTRLVRVIGDAGARAKVRTGGVTAEAFPRPEALVTFLDACAEVDVPFKATAGLHHPVAGRYRLTYEERSPAANMYGYLNVLFATVLTRRSAPDRLVLAVLRESDPAAFRLHAEGVAWGEHMLVPEEASALRERSFVAFGSCSFREPMDELPFGTAAGPSSTESGLAP